jgi:hypothetical protein
LRETFHGFGVVKLDVLEYSAELAVSMNKIFAEIVAIGRATVGFRKDTSPMVKSMTQQIVTSNVQRAHQQHRKFHFYLHQSLRALCDPFRFPCPLVEASTHHGKLNLKARSK